LFFVMVSEVLIYVPSIARFRQTYLEDRIAVAQLASFALTADIDRSVTPQIEQDFLDRAEIKAIVLKREEARTLILGENVGVTQEIKASFDLRNQTMMSSIVDAFTAMASPGRTIRVVAPALEDNKTLVDIVIDEEPLRMEMFSFSARVLWLSLLISAVTAGMVYFALHVLIVRPVRRLTENMVEFRNDPEGAGPDRKPEHRNDEIGIAQDEFAAMQGDLRLALKQKTRLAELGAAVSKINHDLRNILATAQLVSDRLAVSGDPETRRATPVLLRAIDRAILLCTQTLQFGKAHEQKPHRSMFSLRDLVSDVGTALGLGNDSIVVWENRVPGGLNISADHEQLFRVFMNLGRNAVEAIGDNSEGTIALSAATLANCVVVDFSDNGPGVPEAAQSRLFQAFKSSTKPSGTGLGLAIARDLVEAHGGLLTLHRTGESGATFRIELPTNILEMSGDENDQNARVG
jgi:signal transduction histidine kinase